MEKEPEYDFVPQRNPCYGVTRSTSAGAVAGHNSHLQGTAISEGADASYTSLDTATSEGVGVAAKKPARGCPCSWVCIGLVLVGVVACVSMAVAVWSIGEVHTISNSCEAWKESGTAEAVGQVNSESIDEIEELNATFTHAINFLSQNNNQLNATLTNHCQTVDAFHNSVTQAIPGLLPSFPATSCLQVSLYPSGYYWVRASNGSAVRVYCDVTRSCGGVTGGWMRVAHLDFNDTSTSCPSGLRERVDSGIHTCGIESSEAACPSVMFSTSGVEYTKVCGKVIAYQYRSSDAFGSNGRGLNPTIDSNYVDGVSLTHGHTPRNHIWTFAAALDEYGPSMENLCECSHTQLPGTSPPSYVGQDYFCDSGSRRASFIFYGDDPLWDGAGCGSNSTCCSFNNPPWFHKELPSPASDDIEMRVCSDEGRGNEDIAMSSVEIYVQ